MGEQKRPVELSTDFWMMSTPMIQDLYEALMDNNPSGFKGGTRPVENVSWFDAVKCANALSRKQGLKEVYRINEEDVEADWEANGWRLPTEAEWEYAARTGTNFKYAGSNDLDEVAWYGGHIYKDGQLVDDGGGNSRHQTHPVGEKQPNYWGLYDMSGNVREWCWDKFGEYPSAKIDPKGVASSWGRVRRGGSWNFGTGFNTVVYREKAAPTRLHHDIGFRLCRTDI